MVFSVLVPYVAIFAMFFFAFKYFVDKYNISFVYNVEFQGIAVIKKRVVPLMTFNIIVYQVINVGFFVAKTETKGTTYLLLGIAIVIVELLSVIGFYLYNKRQRYAKHKKMRDKQRELREYTDELNFSKNWITSSMVEGTIV